MQFLELKIPPLVLLFALGLVALLFASPLVQGEEVELFSDQAFLSVAVVSFLIGSYVALAGVLEFKRHQTTVDPIHPESASQIVVSGIYSKTRNPMYVGFVLILAGWCLALGVMQALWVLPVYVLYLTKLQIEPEERILLDKYGESFKIGRAHV